MPGWGNVFGFVFDLFGSKAERRRNRIDAIKKEMDNIHKEKATASNVARLERLASELSRLNSEAANS